MAQNKTPGCVKIEEVVGRIRQGSLSALSDVHGLEGGDCGYYVVKLELPKKAADLIHELAYMAADDVDDVHEVATAANGDYVYMRDRDRALVYFEYSRTIYVIRYV